VIHSADKAQIRFDDVRVPQRYCIGEDATRLY
jgi:alkylation response protein AidB-like acyl-CoA dehydrogenase